MMGKKMCRQKAEQSIPCWSPWPLSPYFCALSPTIRWQEGAHRRDRITGKETRNKRRGAKSQNLIILCIVSDSENLISTRCCHGTKQKLSLWVDKDTGPDTFSVNSSRDVIFVKWELDSREVVSTPYLFPFLCLLLQFFSHLPLHSPYE